MTIKIIACEVMKEELLTIMPKEEVEYEFVSMGLHRYPLKLQTELQHMLDRHQAIRRLFLPSAFAAGRQEI